MVLSNNVKNFLRTLVSTVLILIIVPLCEKAKVSMADNTDESFSKMDITCLIDVKDEWNGKDGMQAGYSYELLNKYSKDARINSTIDVAENKENYLDSLKNEKIDILVTHLPKSGKTEGVVYSKVLKDSIVLAISEKNKGKLKEINRWLTQYTGKKSYHEFEDRFFSNYTPEVRARSGHKYKNISPYDSIIKENAKKIGWDWRLLTAVIYQESRFSIDVESHRGAEGLMQIMPKTAERFDVSNPVDPRDNIRIGATYLARLQRMFAKYAADEENLAKFTLAAYNAGEGRILDCINYAQSLGKPCSTWDDILKIIPEMRKDEVLESETVRFGKFQGYETINYIERIMSLYHTFCDISSSNHSRRIGRRAA